MQHHTPPDTFSSRRELIFLILSGFFITNAVLAEVVGGKLINIGPFITTAGVLPWPVVFLTTDLINEYFGRSGVRRLSFIVSGLIIFAFSLVFILMQFPAASISPVTDEAFNMVFGQSLWIVTGSITAFLISQLLDVSVFWYLRQKTGGKHLWARATGSTVVSQLVDTFIVLGIAFWLPGKITTPEYINLSLTNYSYKLLVALALTPAIYLVHAMIDNYLGLKHSKEQIAKAAQESL
ncbi:MAG: queuosine precursor transporter [Bdellovibrionota bacterium]